MIYIISYLIAGFVMTTIVAYLDIKKTLYAKLNANPHSKLTDKYPTGEVIAFVFFITITWIPVLAALVILLIAESLPKPKKKTRSLIVRYFCNKHKKHHTELYI